MHKQILQMNMVNRPIVPGHDAHAIAKGFGRGSQVGELQIANLPIFLVLQQQGLVKFSFGGDQRRHFVGFAMQLGSRRVILGFFEFAIRSRKIRRTSALLFASPFAKIPTR
jgi:hypothetical protein